MERKDGGRGRSRTHQACLSQTSPGLKSGHPTGDDALPSASLAQAFSGQNLAPIKTLAFSPGQSVMEFRLQS